MPHKPVLGKGLSALIAEHKLIENSNDLSSSAPELRVLDVPLNLVEPNPWQPRTEFTEEALAELTESIREHGVLQPIIARKKGGMYQIVAGERRWRASKLANKAVIPAIVVDYDDKHMLEIALVENIQRSNLNPIEEAKAFKLMMDEYGYSHTDLAKKVGKSRSTISNSVRLLLLPQEVQDLVVEKKLSVGHARTLIGKKDALVAARRLTEGSVTVRDAERAAKHSRSLAPYSSEPIPIEFLRDVDLHDVEKVLEEELSMRVVIESGRFGGTLSVKFLTLEQLDMLVHRLGCNFPARKVL